MPMILTTNPKLKKSVEFGYKSYGIHLAPHKSSGHNTCPSTSNGCRNACLFNAGYGVFQKVKTARINKTRRFFSDKQKFVKDLINEITTQVRRSKKNNLIPIFRLNLTSDIAWENIKVEGKNIFQWFPDVQFMDYTKNMPRMLKYLTGKLPTNYHLTFSRSETNQTSCDIVAGCGGNVAVVFYNTLPKTYMKRTVIDGTVHDLRFIDKKNVIVGLIAKGKKAKEDKAGFVVH